MPIINWSPLDFHSDTTTPFQQASPVKNLPEEAERAATKIQAGFKGYKTRKELEGKLSGQQGAPQAASGSENEALQETGTIRGGGGGGGGGGDKWSLNIW